MTCTQPNASSPSLDLSGAYQRQLDHLIAMAKVEGFKAHAWHRAKELDKDQSGIFTGIADALKAAMLGPDKVSASEAPSATKHP